MLLDLLDKRCSVRDFSDKKISQEIINYILEAGRLSPSGGNEQPWKFGVINDKDLIIKISKIAYNQEWIASSNLLIVLCTTIVGDEKGGRDIQKARFPELKVEIEKMDKELYSKLNQEEHQTKIAGTHMVLAALENGIDSTWISYFKVTQLAKLLNLPKDFIPTEIIAFGYPKNRKEFVKKKSIDEIVFYNNDFKR
ncbi:nitroreductase family protein [Halonatronum saccharophilum]|uniref:nitroreductase family protein n=1 Tax=Halonatronum saccharophilum TaxID=150060 RepID=UPI00047FAD6D|nr:nitroreductase family protein [Halonatronum saccharophilum]